MTEPKKLPSYSQEEAAAILARGLDREREGGRVSHDELLETAREIGMSTLEIEAAVAAEVKQRAAHDAAGEARRHAVRRLLQHASAYAIVVAVLFAVDARTMGGVFWHWVALGWGVALAVHAARALRREKVPVQELDAPRPGALEDDASGPRRRSGG